MNTQAAIDPRYHFLPLAEATKPRGGFLNCIKDSYWCVHPERGLAFWGKGHGSPQCNTNESIAKRLCPSCAEIQKIETVFAPLKISDYMDR